MPYLQLITNVKIPDAKAFALEFSKTAAGILGKPEPSISVSITYNETLTFAGSFDPALQLSITTLDNLSPEKNQAYSKALFEFFTEKLGVADDRGYIAFTDPGRDNLGYKGTTVGHISKPVLP